MTTLLIVTVLFATVYIVLNLLASILLVLILLSLSKRILRYFKRFGNKEFLK